MVLDIQELKVQYKIKDWAKLTFEIWSYIFGKVAVFGPALLKKRSIAKKYQKHEIVNNL